MLRVARPELVSWNEVNGKRFVVMDNNPNYRSSLNHANLNFWCHLDFMQLMVELSDSAYMAEIRELFDHAVKANPDLVIIGLS
jgi:hypothetical protein